MLSIRPARAGPSLERRLQHVRWHRLVLPADDAWWNTHYPPNGWGSKCRVRQVSRRETGKLRGPGKAPKMRYRDWKNRRTGKVERGPVSIDLGRDFNLGRERSQRMEAMLEEKEKEFEKMFGHPPEKSG